MPTTNPSFTNPPFVKDLTNAAKDAAYVVVGLGVLGFQQAQVRRREFVDLLSQPGGPLDDRLSGVQDRLADVRVELSKRVQDVDGKLEGAIERIETSFEPLTDRLPEPARDLVKQASAQAKEARTQLWSLLASAAA